jgi:hypothetical protein
MQHWPQSPLTKNTKQKLQHNYNPKSCMILNLCKTEKSSCTSERTQKNEKQETQNKNKEGERERERGYFFKLLQKLDCCVPNLLPSI